MPGAHDFVPFAADLAAWRSQTVFYSGDLEKIAGVSRTTIDKWFRSGQFRHGETFRVSAKGVYAGHRRFTRAGLVRFFRANRMAQALVNIGETPSCHALYVGPDPTTCRAILTASERDVAATSDPFDCGRIMRRDRPSVVIVDFAGHDPASPECAGLLRLCASIRTTAALDQDTRPAVLGFRIPARHAALVDQAVDETDLYPVAVKICGMRMSA